MTKGLLKGVSASFAAAALVLSMAPGAYAAPATYTSATACTAPSQLTVLGFNDFHGRIATASPDTVAFFGTIEKERQSATETKTLVLSSGDNIGASLFASAVADDQPTIDMLNAMQIDSSTIGNHEFDRGFADMTGRVTTNSKFPYLSANLYKTGTKTPYFKPYQVFTRAGVRVAVIGAVTGDLKSLVAPEVFKNVDLGDPVEAVNAAADKIVANNEADVIIASYHEGASVSEPKTLDDATATTVFNDIVTKTSPKVAAILTAHTHQAYAWQAPVPGTNRTRPVIESNSYGALVGKTVLTVDTAAGKVGTVCASTTENVKPVASSEVAALSAQYPRVAQVAKITQAALDDAEVKGSVKVATATGPITRGLKADGSPDNRAAESTLSDMVAQMFYDTLSAGNANFIGVQNPGGTRADLPAGDVTYSSAAAVLPFANTLMTTQLTGAQVKTMLEQQWQTNADGTIPGRPYLQLGLSKNVTYTFDESRAAGDRITSISVNGKPIDPKGTYTIGSGNFLITGGDNFRVLADGKNTRDTGASDLAAWVDWLKTQKTVSPDVARQAVQVSGPASITPTVAATFVVGTPVDKGLQADTLDMNSTGTPKNTTLVATIGGVKVGTATVTDGKATITVTAPLSIPAGKATLQLVSTPTGTTITLPVTVTAGPGFTPASGTRPAANGLIGESTGDRFADIWAMDAKGQLDFYGYANKSVTPKGVRGTALTNITYMAAVTDQNGDKRADLIYRDKADNGLYFAYNQGNGYLVRGKKIGANWAGMDQFWYAGTMVNGSPNQYLLARRSGDGTLWRYQLTSTGLKPAVQVGHGWDGMRVMTSPGNMFGDAAWDVVGIRKDGKMFGYEVRKGQLISRGEIGHGWGAMTSAFIPGDISGDGRLDLIGQRFDGTLWAYANTKGGFVTIGQVGTGFGSYKLMA